ncbi:pentatricopeptide repeat-containing protein At1g08070, chloroplastic-like [Selaginella moellendorffii]|uniref:pentatricopeptide repeat-containing protein At1g08070, chloroplastic-like n=1 Tax=Selaginella moellendorffii TaxID=88036 RepID=UPI000D1C2F6F|nr:pentatricopeptide repeat-containing protein At1g08070, chloroplastic-like [Selaginella moellendorffii]|eukprot:XP_024536052.1 pentatricopeptide repeat-containing protein At1g08070, chloroplastic-like [Selaginella moellendorffii]
MPAGCLRPCSRETWCPGRRSFAATRTPGRERSPWTSSLEWRARNVMAVWPTASLTRRFSRPAVAWRHWKLEERSTRRSVAKDSRAMEWWRTRWWTSMANPAAWTKIPSKSLVSWSALIAGYSFQGQAQAAFETLEGMLEQRVRPSDVTYLSLLAACSHAGLVDRGEEFFEEMCAKHEIVPGIQHYTCMVDLLRANRLSEAVAMEESMPCGADAVIWMALHKWKNVGVARLAFEAVMKLASGNMGVLSSACVLMSNVYAGVGMWEEYEKLQNRTLRG